MLILCVVHAVASVVTLFYCYTISLFKRPSYNLPLSCFLMKEMPLVLHAAINVCLAVFFGRAAKHAQIDSANSSIIEMYSLIATRMIVFPIAMAITYTMSINNCGMSRLTFNQATIFIMISILEIIFLRFYFQWYQSALSGLEKALVDMPIEDPLGI